ncbi:hypothetical protein TanjilG_13284 [Lupinus angustifolius]|uniref:UspA domain-containing protein n=1 Tax=Lupinus angustifolius TaxID=3871 RepID=A0A4P1RUR0_LUPAN|nr:PREDICTED: uncharacterized protein LOC109353919 [Lupinus angustifolius]OIW18532.1 hypothetical protein TanjilG_13284 [Lupinus angustifolius]
MGRRCFRLHSLCISIGHVTPHVRACSSSSLRTKSSSSDSIKYANITEYSSHDSSSRLDNSDKESAENGNKVMVVVDSTFEGKGALEWALSHTVQTHDTVILVHVTRPTREGGESPRKFNLKAYNLLLDMKNICETKKPGVQVNIVMLEGDEKGGAIVQEAKQQRVSLLVVGQRKRSMLWSLMKRLLLRKRTKGGVADYCIHNSPCITVAVRSTNKKLGDYFITTKRHKKFWLLA